MKDYKGDYFIDNYDEKAIELLTKIIEDNAEDTAMRLLDLQADLLKVTQGRSTILDSHGLMVSDADVNEALEEDWVSREATYG